MMRVSHTTSSSRKPSPASCSPLIPHHRSTGCTTLPTADQPLISPIMGLVRELTRPKQDPRANANCCASCGYEQTRRVSGPRQVVAQEADLGTYPRPGRPGSESALPSRVGERRRRPISGCPGLLVCRHALIRLFPKPALRLRAIWVCLALHVSAVFFHDSAFIIHNSYGPRARYLHTGRPVIVTCPLISEEPLCKWARTDRAA